MEFPSSQMSLQDFFAQVLQQFPSETRAFVASWLEELQTETLRTRELAEQNEITGEMVWQIIRSHCEKSDFYISVCEDQMQQYVHLFLAQAVLGQIIIQAVLLELEVFMIDDLSQLPLIFGGDFYRVTFQRNLNNTSVSSQLLPGPLPLFMGSQS